MNYYSFAQSTVPKLKIKLLAKREKKRTKLFFNLSSKKTVVQISRNFHFGLFVVYALQFLELKLKVNLVRGSVYFNLNTKLGTVDCAKEYSFLFFFSLFFFFL